MDAGRMGQKATLNNCQGDVLRRSSQPI